MKGVISESRMVPKSAVTPFVTTIPSGQWSGSGSDYYVQFSASNITADAVLVPHYDHASEANLNGPIWCVPAAGSFTIHTTAIPSNTVTIMVQFVGTLGTAQYQVLSDVYSKSQVDSIVAQSTAKTRLYAGAATPNSGTSYALSDSILNYEYVMIKCLTNTEIQSQIFVTDMLLESNRNPLFLAMSNNSSGLVSDFGYKAYCIVSFSSNGSSFTVAGAWTNVNYIIKPQEIYGIKHV